ncbi:hypothetical protein [Verrucomicrobium spinosum]|uniref:hypothetical protein n=1 Tax=Verrucomicrobium spinosum TaxID=2736 RepID=UPI0012E14969|nr:hypothetical protein [Verrucomicrobium spinosum]
MKAFGADVTLDKRGLPVPPRTPPDGYPLLQPTREKKTAILDEAMYWCALDCFQLAWNFHEEN